MTNLRGGIKEDPPEGFLRMIMCACQRGSRPTAVLNMENVADRLSARQWGIYMLANK